jgi:putative resolvase
MKEEKKLLRIAEAAILLGVHSNTLRQWDKKGILKAVRFGVRKDRRYKKNDISSFIEKSNHKI